MKSFNSCVLAAAVMSFAGVATVHADAPPAGQVDFGTFTASASGGEFVEVNVTSSLISFATKAIEKDQPDVAQVLKGLQLVRVNVVGLGDDNRSDIMTRVQGIRDDLE